MNIELENSIMNRFLFELVPAARRNPSLKMLGKTNFDGMEVKFYNSYDLDNKAINFFVDEGDGMVQLEGETLHYEQCVALSGALKVIGSRNFNYNGKTYHLQADPQKPYDGVIISPITMQ